MYGVWSSVISVVAEVKPQTADSDRFLHESQSELKISQILNSPDERWTKQTKRLRGGERARRTDWPADVVSSAQLEPEWFRRDARDTHTGFWCIFGGVVSSDSCWGGIWSGGPQHMVCFSGWSVQLYSGPEVVPAAPAGSLEADLSSEALNNPSWPSQVCWNMINCFLVF